MNLRQVHLDFHTSEKIENIGCDFDKKQFQEALIKGHIDSVTLFSKCHHGWAYHPSKANEMHPNLKFDLLGCQIEAAHEIGVKTPVYLSAGIDEKYAVTHKNHLIRNKDQTIMGVPDFLTPGYHLICFNTPYLDYLLAQIKEVCENYDADGIFLDILGVRPCYCESCMNQLIAKGKNPSDESVVMDLAEHVYANYLKKVRETVDSVKPGLPVFHNGGHIRHGRRDLAYANTHLELESLPTGGWGYDHFPVSAAYARTLGMEYLGMTGKFHTTWGEFGGFKHPNALWYETSLSIANGAGCSVGDQLHPSGKMDMATYTIIGKAYAEVEKKEEYIKGYKNITDIAVLSTEAVDNYYFGTDISTGFSTSIGDANAGCARILLEGKYLFNYIDLEEDFSKYKLIIMPDTEIADEFIKSKLTEYVKKGGKILATGKSGTDKYGNFVLDFGCEFDGENKYKPSYIRPNFELKSIDNSAYVIYSSGYKLKNITGKALANCENPYFNRTFEHFCSHQHTPNNPKDSFVSVVEGKDGIYVGFDMFTEYAKKGSMTVKEIMCHLIDTLLPEKTIKTNLPAQGVIELTKKGNKRVVHLLYASPVKRGVSTEIIEDILPILDTEVCVISEPPKRVFTAPQKNEIEFKYENGYVKFSIDKFECHQMIVLEF